MTIKEDKHRFKVLAIAEAANPSWTSVPLVGWSLANALQSVAEVHLVTQIRNKQAILDFGYVEKKDFTAIDSELVMKPLWKLSTALRGGAGKGWTTSSAINALGYYYFEYLVWKRFKNDIINGEFDIVHRITPLSPTVPSLLAKKCQNAGVPFVLGPINGGVPWPKGFNKERNQEKEWLSYVRSAYKLLPGYRSTLKSTAAIIVGSQDTLAQLPNKIHSKCVYLPENAVDPKKFPPKKRQDNNNKIIRACFVGRLVPYKGPDILLEAALPLLRNQRLTIDIIGDGPLMPNLKRLITKEKVEEYVTLHGLVDHTLLQPIMCKSRIFTFPSIREFGGGVVLEAMALGLVPIVVDYAGPGELVTSDVGLKVPIGSREEIIISFRSVLEKVITGKIDLDQLAENSIHRIRNSFTWESKSRQVNSVYQWIINRDIPKPNFF